MGLTFHEAKMLLDARRRGTSFERALTIAHQTLYLHSFEVKQLRREFLTVFPNATKPPLAEYRWADYADSFFRDLLGATTLDTLDNSAYEGATIVHDLNQPVASELWGKYDAVVDGGSLEHIFNFPVALTGLMRMVRVGGSIFLTLPANNLCGHGFYQFSPELMFRVFSQENGFRLLRVVLLKARFPGVELCPVAEAYEVTDPVKVRKRVGLVSTVPVMMMVEAVKTREVTPFAVAPQQSDYVAIWRGGVEPSNAGRGKTVLKGLSSRLPRFIQNRLLGHYQNWMFSFQNRRFYKKLR